jgi:DNA-binding transcriptional regulator YbjK
MAPPAYRDYRLPRGNHGLSRAQVAENQRLRLIGAGSELLAEGRLLGLTSRRIAHRAGVSSHTFYEHFENVDALLTAAFANATQLLVELIAGACTAGVEDRDEVQGALAAAVSLAGQEPGLAALFRVEVAVAIAEVGAERERLSARIAALGKDRGGDRGGIYRVSGALGLAIERLEEDVPGAAITLPGELALVLA